MSEDQYVDDIEFAVAPETLDLAHRLDLVAGVTRDFMDMPSADWPGSIFARERASQDQYSALPYQYLGTHVGLMPLSFIGVAEDHLIALASILRTPRTIMATLTVLRTLVVAAAAAAYVSDPNVDHAERCRRALNYDLVAQTEQMRMFAVIADPDARTKYGQRDMRRNEIMKGARVLGWHGTSPATPKSGWPGDWWIGDKPLQEMRLVDSMLGPATPSTRLGSTLYQYLSATSHAQQHGFASFAQRETSMDHGDGSRVVRLGMSGELIATLAVVALGSLSIAMGYCARFYGWQFDRWVSEVRPLLHDLSSALGATQYVNGIPLL